jgi:hypothetical protein
MSPQFIKARRRGRIAQDYCAQMFQSWNLKVDNVKDGYFPGWDMIVSGNLHGSQVNFKAEVKYDIKAQDTGNVYLDIATLSHSKASILCICLNDPIDTVLMLPLQSALDYAQAHKNIHAGEFKEAGCLVDKAEFIADLKPQILKTKV